MKINSLIVFCLIPFLFFECKKSQTQSGEPSFAQKISLLKRNWIEDSLNNASTGRTFKAIQPSYLHIDSSLNYSLIQNLDNNESESDTGQIVFQSTSMVFSSNGGNHYLAGFGIIYLTSVTENTLILNANLPSNNTTWYFHR